MPHLLGYARVSTADQNPDLQLDALRASGCYRLSVDTASGALDERPQLARILDHLRSGDTLVVWKLDRLGRSLRHLIDTIAELERRDIGFRSVQENIDTTTPGGKLIFHIFGALAEFERYAEFGISFVMPSPGLCRGKCPRQRSELCTDRGNGSRGRHNGGG